MLVIKKAIELPWLNRLFCELSNVPRNLAFMQMPISQPDPAQNIRSNKCGLHWANKHYPNTLLIRIIFTF